MGGKLEKLRAETGMVSLLIKKQQQQNLCCREVTLGVYALSVVGMVAFLASFFSASIWVVYLTSFLLG